MTNNFKLFKLTAKHHIFLYVVVLIAFPTQANQSLKISAWNMEWLVNHGNERFVTSLRESDDFYKMANYLTLLDPDILAFQEVGDVEAIARVVGDDYTLYFSDRMLAKNHILQFNDINQYTGFAVRKGIKVTDVADFSLLPAKRADKLRFASYVVIKVDGEQVHLLNVHLKAGCSGRYKPSSPCNTLKQQAKTLNQWVVEKEQRHQQYIIAGDFNHGLAYRNDWLWQEISNNTKAVLATQDVAAKCKVKSRNDPKRTHQFRSLIDHIIVSSDIVVEDVGQQVYRTDDVLNYQLSDHCPLFIEVKL